MARQSMPRVRGVFAGDRCVAACADAARRYGADRAARAGGQALAQAADPRERGGVLRARDRRRSARSSRSGAERALNPASTIKLVTTYAGLELLGPAYTWVTEAYAAGPLNQDVLAAISC